MGLESVTWITDLVTANPPNTDLVQQGDDHIRNIKTALKNVFKNASKAFYFPYSLAAATTTQTLTSTDAGKVVLMDCTSGALTVNLPASGTIWDGFEVTVVKVDSSANAVTIDGNASEQVNGALTATISLQFNALRLVWCSTFTQWVAFRDLPAAATTSAAGLVELATDAEAAGGTDTTRYITSAQLHESWTDVASAGTTNIGAAASNAVRITGTTTITAFDNVADGVWRDIRFAGALTLTHNATSLILPSGANITTAAGDCAKARSLGSGNWVVLAYERASGQALVGSSGSTIAPQAEVRGGSATITIPTNATKLLIFLVGGGGGGGGAKTVGCCGPTASGGAGGGAGALIKYLSGLTPGNTLALTIGGAGSGGAGVTPSNGTAGGNSTLASGTETITTLTAGGGGLGTAGNNTAGTSGSGGTSTNGDVNFSGQNGVNRSGGNNGESHGGAPGLGFGVPGRGMTITGGVAGVGGNGWGAGGSGGAQIGSASNQNGGNGAAGGALFFWFA